ncbi:MAG TPA: hypothetical protein VNN07_03520 [Candidatus Tectomicrobia bacterium]|nr:hypothetical protein [Candidatus Tectomicrobia bacterium]
MERAADARERLDEGLPRRELEATLDDLVETIHAHPTWPEATAEAALAARGLALHLLRPREPRPTVDA